MGRGPRPGGRASGRDPGVARARRRRGVRRRRADQREGLPAGQVRQSRAGDRQHRLQRPLLHGQRRGRGEPVPRGGPGPAVPAGRPRRRAGGSPARQQRRRDHAAVRAAPRRLPGRGPDSSWSTRAAARPPSSPWTARGTTSSRCRAPTSSSCSPCCTSSSPRAWPTRHTSRSAPPGSRSCGGRSRRGGPSGPSAECGVPADPAARHRPPAGGRQPVTRRRRRVHPHRTRGGAVDPGDGHRLGRHQPRAGPRPARPPGLRLRRPHRPGQRAGRAGARPEGRPAARLPDDRRPRRAGARRGGVGRRPRVAARHGRAGGRAPRRARHPDRTAGAAGARVERRRQRAQRRAARAAAARPRPPRGLRLRALRDGSSWPTSCCPSPSGPRRRAP